MLNFIWLEIDSSVQTNDSTVLVTRLWLYSTKSWPVSDSTIKILDDPESKELWLWPKGLVTPSRQ